MTGLTTIPNTATLADAVDVVDRDGGVIVDSLVDPDGLAGLWADLGPSLRDGAFGPDDFMGGRTKRISALLAKTRHLFPVITHPLYHGLAEHYLCRPIRAWSGDRQVERVATMQVGVTQLIEIHPGEGAQYLHRDDGIFHWRHPSYGREARVQIMLALSDFTAENGGTLVIPGSHRWDDERAPQMSEAVSTEMSAGSALIWLGSTYHGGGTNRSDSIRTGLTMALDLAYLRQEENQFLSLPIDVVATFPEQIQRLVGYSISEPYLGFVEIDGVLADPIVLLHKGTPA